MKYYLIVLLFLGSYVQSEAQLLKTDALHLELEQQDSIFFERGFNQCDMDYLEQHIAEDLRFFHDQSGYQDRTTFFSNTRQYICGNQDQKPIRKVDTESIDVFPLYDNGRLYGAIQSGIHHFYIREEGKEDRHTSTARFTSVWIKKDNQWMLTEVLSYDHK